MVLFGRGIGDGERYPGVCFVLTEAKRALALGPTDTGMALSTQLTPKLVRLAKYHRIWQQASAFQFCARCQVTCLGGCSC